MKKKKSTRLINAGDILLTIICLIGMAVALYLFWDDLNITLSKQDETPIAVVYFKKNTVQRRLVDRNLWERIQQAAPVYEGDRIRTSQMSEAVTVFADGTEIEIHENTLIQIYTQKERAAVDFISGAITAIASGFEGEETETAPLLIKTGDKVVELDAGSEASVSAPVSSAAVKKSVVTTEAGNKTAQAEKTETEKPTAVAITVTKGTAAVRDAVQDDSYRQKSEAPSVIKVAQNSITDLGTTARQVFDTVTAAPESESVQLAAEKKVMQAGEVSLVKVTEPEPSGTTDSTDSAVPETETGKIRNATLYLPASSTSIQLEQGAMPIIQAQWEATDPLLFEFARDASYTDILFTRMYPAVQTQAFISLEEYQDAGTLFWRTRFADDPDSVFASGVILMQEPPDETTQEMIDRVINDEETIPIKDEPDTQEEAIKAEAIRKEEEERRAREEAARLDAEKAAAERAEAERIAAEKAAAERAEAERIAAEKAAAERAEAERIAAEKAAAERAEAERIAAEKAAAERAEAERIAAEKAAAEKAEAERIAAEKAAAERAEAERIAAEKAAAEKAEAERIAAEKAAAERAEAERIAAEKAAAERAEQERIAAEKAAAERAEQERIAAEKAAAEKAEAERIAAEKAAAERAEQERIAAEKAAAERAEQERIAAEKAAAERAEQERIAAEKAAMEQARRVFAAATPVLRSPADATLMDDTFFDRNSRIAFSWVPVSDASSYKVTIVQKGIVPKTVLNRKVTGTQLTLTDLSVLDEGEFEWTVTGVMADGTESKTATSSFSVKLNPLENIELDTSNLFRR